MRSSKTIIKGVAVLVVMALPMVAGAANKKLVVRNATDTADAMVVLDDGKIGIGTAAPPAALSVIAAGTYIDAQVQLQNNATGATPASSAAPSVSFYRGNAEAANFLPRASDYLGYIGFGGLKPGRVDAARIITAAEQAWTTTTYPAYMSFLTNSTADGFKERARITSNGNLGLGTTAPSQKLEVNGGVRLNTATVRPDCIGNTTQTASTGYLNRGTMWFAKGTPDRLYVCAADASGIFDWRTLGTW